MCVQSLHSSIQWGLLPQLHRKSKYLGFLLNIIYSEFLPSLSVLHLIIEGRVTLVIPGGVGIQTMYKLFKTEKLYINAKFIGNFKKLTAAGLGIQGSWGAVHPKTVCTSVHLYICTPVHLYICTSVHLYFYTSALSLEICMTKCTHATTVCKS